jgi:hypothetical protein
MATLLAFEPAGEIGEEYLWKANKEIPASLLARLAEAADGTRNNEPIYFVAALKPVYAEGHDVIGFFKSIEEAATHAQAKPLLECGRYMIFGPYQTKDEDYPPKGIEKVVIHRKDRDPVDLAGGKFDCVFWSLSAVDKFLIPYYVSMGDLATAEKIRCNFMKEEAIAAIHIPGSDIVNEIPIQIGSAADGELNLQQLQYRVGAYMMNQ